MATLNKPSSMAQSEIDRHNRYLSRYNTMSNPTQADHDTVKQIQTLYGANFNQNGIDPTKWSGQAQQSYLLENPYQAQQKATNSYNTGVQNNQNSYENSQQKADANKWNNATIQDIAAKYGFDYSRDYAKQQAEAEAQALRNANADAQRKNASNKDLNKKGIDNNLMNQVEGMDRNYFQKMLTQGQEQVNSGLNAGIASDQDLRLQMSRQAEMGASYRDANLGHMQEDQRFTNEDLRLAESLGLINQQSLAREDSLYNDRLQQGYGQLMNERQIANQLDQQQWGRSQTENDRLMQLLQTNLGQANFQTQDSYGRLQDNIKNKYNQAQFDWTKRMDESALTGNFNSQRTLAGQNLDWGKQQDTIKNAQWEKQFAEDVRQFGLQYALQKQAASGGGGGGGGYAGTTSGTSAPASNLAQQFSEYQKAATNQPKTFEDRFYQPKIEAISKMIPVVSKDYQKAINGIKAPTSIDRMLDLFTK